MSNNIEKPDVEKIIDSLRQGLNDTTPFDESQHKMDTLQKLKSTLRKATETAEILGRCDGSMRGSLCKKAAWLAKPVAEQMDMHNAAVVKALTLLNEAQAELFENRIKKLEDEIASLKREKMS